MPAACMARMACGPSLVSGPGGVRCSEPHRARRHSGETTRSLEGAAFEASFVRCRRFPMAACAGGERAPPLESGHGVPRTASSASSSWCQGRSLKGRAPLTQWRRRFDSCTATPHVAQQVRAPDVNLGVTGSSPVMSDQTCGLVPRIRASRVMAPGGRWTEAESPLRRGGGRQPHRASDPEVEWIPPPAPTGRPPSPSHPPVGCDGRRVGLLGVLATQARLRRDRGVPGGPVASARSLSPSARDDPGPCGAS